MSTSTPFRQVALPTLIISCLTGAILLIILITADPPKNSLFTWWMSCFASAAILSGPFTIILTHIRRKRSQNTPNHKAEHCQCQHACENCPNKDTHQ